MPFMLEIQLSGDLHMSVFIYSRELKAWLVCQARAYLLVGIILGQLGRKLVLAGIGDEVSS